MTGSKIGDGVWFVSVRYLCSRRRGWGVLRALRVQGLPSWTRRILSFQAWGVMVRGRIKLPQAANHREYSRVYLDLVCAVVAPGVAVPGPMGACKWWLNIKTGHSARSGESERWEGKCLEMSSMVSETAMSVCQMHIYSDLAVERPVDELGHCRFFLVFELSLRNLNHLEHCWRIITKCRQVAGVLGPHGGGSTTRQGECQPTAQLDWQSFLLPRNTFMPAKPTSSKPSANNLSRFPHFHSL